MNRWIAGVFVSVAICGVAGALVGGAQQAPGRPPTFHAGTDIVQVDVSVLDSKRRPVRGLTAADFTLLEDGQRRAIDAFAEVDLPDRVTATEPTWSRDLVPDVATNRVSEDEGRLVVILMDRSIPPGVAEATARRVALAAVDALGPSDLGAVISTNGGAAQGLTSDRARLRRAINRGGLTSDVSAEAKEIQAATAPPGDPLTALTDGRCMCGECVLRTIMRVAEALQDAPRRRKILLFVGSSLTVQTADSGGDQTGCAYVLKSARAAMFQAVDRANLTVHSLDPGGLNLVGPVSQARSTLRTRDVAGASTAAMQENLKNDGSLRILPDRTGGRAVTNTNGPEERIPDIYRESGSYYVLGFRPTEGGARADQFRPIKVVVNRRDVNVHTRSGYLVPAAPALALAAVSTPASSPSPALRASLAGSLPDASVPLDLNTAVFASPGTKSGLVTVAVGITGFAPAVASTTPVQSPLEIVAGAFDRNGQSQASARQTLQLAWPPAAGGPRRVDALTRLDLPPGEYELRVGVTDEASMRTASVFTFVTVPPFGPTPLSLSSIVLGATAATTSVPAGFFETILPVAPTAQREFASSESVTGFVRIYQGTERTSPVRPVQIRARVLDAKGQAAIEHTFVLDAGQFTANRAGDCRITLPLSRLTPGDYLLTVDTTMDDKTAGRALRFRVK